MNQELQNYINQSRQEGKSEEVIRQELKNAGWQEGEIFQALGGYSQVAQMIGVGASAVAKTSGVSKVLISVILAVVVTGGIGLGVYFALNNKQGGKLAAQTGFPLADDKTGKRNKVNPMNISSDCREILSDSDFEKITGNRASDYQIISYPFAGPDPSAILQFFCKYISKDQYAKNIADLEKRGIKLSDLKIEISGGGQLISFNSSQDMIQAITLSSKNDYEFSVLYYADNQKSASDWYEPVYSGAKIYAQGEGGNIQIGATVRGEKSDASFQGGEGGSVNISANGQTKQIISKTTVTDISGIGSAAFLSVAESSFGDAPVKIIYMLSSNKKFALQLMNTLHYSSSYDSKTGHVLTKAAEIQTREVMESFAKAIDLSMGKQ